MSKDGQIIAGRSTRRAPSPEEARADLATAQAELVAAFDRVNAAIHNRGRACQMAHDAGLTWEEIGDWLGGIRHHSALELAQRWRVAVGQGHRLKLKQGSKR